MSVLLVKYICVVNISNVSWCPSVILHDLLIHSMWMRGVLALFFFPLPASFRWLSSLCNNMHWVPVIWILCRLAITLPVLQSQSSQHRNYLKLHSVKTFPHTSCMVSELSVFIIIQLFPDQYFNLSIALIHDQIPAQLMTFPSASAALYVHC